MSFYVKICGYMAFPDEKFYQNKSLFALYLSFLAKKDTLFKENKTEKSGAVF